MRTDLRRLADQREIDVADRIAGIFRQFDCMGDELGGRGTLPALVARWKVLAYVTQRTGAENGIDDGVQRDIRVAVAGKAPVVLDPEPAEPQLLTCGEAVDVIA